MVKFRLTRRALRVVSSDKRVHESTAMLLNDFRSFILGHSQVISIDGSEFLVVTENMCIEIEALNPMMARLMGDFDRCIIKVGTGATVNLRSGPGLLSMLGIPKSFPFEVVYFIHDLLYGPTAVATVFPNMRDMDRNLARQQADNLALALRYIYEIMILDVQKAPSLSAKMMHKGLRLLGGCRFNGVPFSEFKRTLGPGSVLVRWSVM